MLPKVRDAGHVRWLDLLLTQVERAAGLPVGRHRHRGADRGRAGLAGVDAIAAASPRLETLVFGPGDLMASINMKTLVVGEQPPATPRATPTTTS